MTWIDPICALIALAIFKKEPEGTKLSFNDNAISFNPPGPLQSTIRKKEGSSRHDLYNLTPAIYYSIKWLNLTENSKYEIIFKMAKEGILRMVADTYRDDLMTQQYLTTTHLKMLNDALEKKNILREEFMIPNHDENPLNKRSNTYWLNSNTYLDELPYLLSEFDKNPEIKKGSLMRKMNEVVLMHKNYLKSILTGLSDPPEFEELEFDVITVKIKDQHDKSDSAEVASDKDELKSDTVGINSSEVIENKPIKDIP